VDGHSIWLHSPAIGTAGEVIRYGHWGRPVLVFPAERGRAYDFAANGMVDAVAPLIEAGRVKLYCVDAYDGESWSNAAVPLEDRAQRHNWYESWILDEVAPSIVDDCGGRSDIATTGASMGAFHALNFAFRRADLFPVALCLSGNYDPTTWNGWGERGDALYFNNPSNYVANLHGEHLDWLRGHLSIVLVCGQGQWEDTTGALDSTRQMAGILADKGIRHELDLWGTDTAHDWPAWRAQLAYHLPRLC
jgi:esterase/lipase superfamily enzyme